MEKGWSEVIEFQPPGAVERLEMWTADNAEALSAIPPGGVAYDVAPSSAGPYIRVRALDGLTGRFREVDETEFSSPSPNLIVSSRGFSVEVVGRFRLRYRENANEISIACEPLMGHHFFGIWARDIEAWDTPDAPVQETDRIRILVNLERALAWRGWPLQVTDRSGRLVTWDHPSPNNDGIVQTFEWRGEQGFI